ncbi:hypothetical protein AAY473_021334 [Plecturocebus cupreus]
MDHLSQEFETNLAHMTPETGGCSGEEGGWMANAPVRQTASEDAAQCGRRPWRRRVSAAWRRRVSAAWRRRVSAAVEAAGQCGLEVEGQCGLETEGQCDLEAEGQCDLETEGQCGLERAEGLAVRSVRPGDGGSVRPGGGGSVRPRGGGSVRPGGGGSVQPSEAVQVEGQCDLEAEGQCGLEAEGQCDRAGGGSVRPGGGGSVQLCRQQSAPARTGASSSWRVKAAPQSCGVRGSGGIDPFPAGLTSWNQAAGEPASSGEPSHSSHGACFRPRPHLGQKWSPAALNPRPQDPEPQFNPTVNHSVPGHLPSLLSYPLPRTPQLTFCRVLGLAPGLPVGSSDWPCPIFFPLPTPAPACPPPFPASMNGAPNSPPPLHHLVYAMDPGKSKHPDSLDSPGHCCCSLTGRSMNNALGASCQEMPWEFLGSQSPPPWHFVELRQVDHLRPGVRDQPGQCGETPSLPKIQKLARLGGGNL